MACYQRSVRVQRCKQAPTDVFINYGHVLRVIRASRRRRRRQSYTCLRMIAHVFVHQIHRPLARGGAGGDTSIH